ncbi:MAG: hypothetical protein IMHGJWDQ_001698 [Candidatus Fervidibacter sp.]
MRWLWTAMVFVTAQGRCAEEPLFQIPPPENQLSMDEAKDLYHSFELFVSHYPQRDPLPLPIAYVRLLERILLDFPDERFLFRPRGLGLPARVERGYARAWLAASYQAQGKWDETLALRVQDFFIRWIESIEKKSGLLYGFPAFPSLDPFRGDPPAAVLHLAKRIKEMQEKDTWFSPLIFVRGWCLRARWKGKELKDALIPLNDFAYALGGEKWRDIISHDWKAWCFTISVKGKTVSFQAGSKKAKVNGKEVTLTHPAERSFYDLYVPLVDLVRALGGVIRPPKADELVVFQRHLPVSLLVVDLD